MVRKISINGNAIRQERIRQCYTVIGLAKKAKVSTGTLHRLEKGYGTELSVSKIARALGLNYEDFIIEAKGA